MKKELRDYMKKIGRKGGQAAAAKLNPSQRRARGQAAVRNRWKGHAPSKRARRSTAMSPRLRAKNDFPGSMYRNPCPTCGAAPFTWCVTLGGIARPGYPHADRGTALPREGFHR